MVGHVSTPGGVDVAEELVLRGLVFAYTRYLSDCDGPNLLLLESQVRDSQKLSGQKLSSVLRGPGFIGEEPMQDFVTL